MKISFDGAGDVIVVTGGGNGIGRALAIAACDAGARVVVCDVDQTAMTQLAVERPAISTRLLDVSDHNRVSAVFGEIETEFGPVDGLVCGAAIQPRSALAEMEVNEWKRVIDINLNGVVWCCQAAIPSMVRRRKGSIVAFSSGLAHQGWPKASAYAASKAALIAFVKSVAKEVAKNRVRINLIFPGVIDTPQYRAANEGGDDERWRKTLGVGSPQDVIGPLLFLLSDAATMTASVLSRDFAYPRSDFEGAP
jgi:2-hydroxycyclohexanecarboxyl-CoA dehydrogenase